MAEQLTIELPVRPALGRDDFFVSPANREALAAVDNWRNWPDGKLVLTGARGAGKSHLAHVWAAEARARVLPASGLGGLAPDRVLQDARRLVVEDIDAVAGDPAHERALLHLHNMILAEDGRLLMTRRPGPVRFDLPDLQSRVQGSAVAAIAPADDALLGAVLIKLFADRQLHVDAAVIGFLSRRMERSLEQASHLVSALDATALARGKKVGLRLAGEVLDKLSRERA